MSGIVGLVHLDGKPAEHGELESMLSVIAHRGPDGKKIWRERQAGLGNCLLHITPESPHEQLPLKSESGDFIITADARLDNREELLNQLGLTRYPAHQIADSRLILAAYEKWGERCVEKL
ncbi:MAG: lasso peptide isopeptide bond-forming cyclase, partial [bacterium]